MSVSSDSPITEIPRAEASSRDHRVRGRLAVGPPRVATTDGELLTLFTRGGDQAAFDELVQRHAAMVWRVCRQSLRREQDAEDAFQATFLLLVRNARSIRASESAAGWLYRVAYRTSMRARKRLSARREESLALDPHAPEETAFPDLARRQTAGLLAEELVRLPAKYQEPLVMRYLEGQSRRAIADATDSTVAAVQGRLARGKQLLRRRLVRRGVSLSAAMAVLAARPSEAAHVPAQVLSQTTTNCSAVATGGSLVASAAVVGLYQQGVRAMFAAWFAKPAGVAAAVVLAALVAAAPDPSTAGPDESGALTLTADLAAMPEAPAAEVRLAPAGDLGLQRDPEEQPTAESATSTDVEGIATEPSVKWRDGDEDDLGRLKDHRNRLRVAIEALVPPGGDPARPHGPRGGQLMRTYQAIGERIATLTASPEYVDSVLAGVGEPVARDSRAMEPTLAAQDSLDITIWGGETEYGFAGGAVVDWDGSIKIHGIDSPAPDVGGKTLAEAARVITEHVRGELNDPSLRVRVGHDQFGVAGNVPPPAANVTSPRVVAEPGGTAVVAMGGATATATPLPDGSAELVVESDRIVIPNATITPLKELVRLREQRLQLVESQASAGQAQTLEVVRAKALLTDARARLAEARGDATAAIAQREAVLELRERLLESERARYADGLSSQERVSEFEVARIEAAMALHGVKARLAGSAKPEAAAEFSPTGKGQPKVVATIPERGATGVDPDLTEVRITFDRDMSTAGYSFTGNAESGMPPVPKAQKPEWIDKRTCVLPVRLEPGREYRVGINAPSYKNFKAADGTPAAIDEVRFTTAEDTIARQLQQLDLLAQNVARIEASAAELLASARADRGENASSPSVVTRAIQKRLRSAISEVSESWRESESRLTTWVDDQLNADTPLDGVRQQAEAASGRLIDLEGRLQDLRGQISRPFDYVEATNPPPSPKSDDTGDQYGPQSSMKQGQWNCLHRTTELNPAGWATVAELKLGEYAPIKLPGDQRPRPHVRLESVEGTSARFTIVDPDYPQDGEAWDTARGAAIRGARVEAHVLAAGVRPVSHLIVIREVPTNDAGEPVPLEQPPNTEDAKRLLHDGEKREASTRRTRASLTGAQAPPVATEELHPIAAGAASRVDHTDGKAEGKKSLGGGGHLIRFELPEDAAGVKSLRVHGARYGTRTAPREDFEITFLSEDRSEILAVKRAAYGLFRRGDEKWTTVRFDSPVVDLPETFWVAIDFNPERTKGVYVSYDTSTGGERSMIGLAQDDPAEHRSVDFGGDWMVSLILERGDASASPPARAAGPPTVVKTVPERDATDVDPGLREVRVTFDRDMDRRGYSFTGNAASGMPEVPKGKRPRWVSKRTCVLPVRLEPGRAYRVGINAPSFQKFRSASGEPAEIDELRFETAG